MHIARRLPSPAALGRPAAVLAVALALAFTAAPAPAHAASSIRLMIDPGHGGSDPGALGPGIQEKDSNLTISRMVEQAARRQGWDVAMTRGDDRFVGLVERPQAAGAFRATDFVSIHSNSTGNAAEGFMSIYRTPAGARLGSRIMAELDPLTPYGDIGNRADVRGLAVLRHAPVANAVLVELLSVTAPSENAALKDPARRREMAEAVVRGIARYHNVRYYAPVAARPAPQPAPQPAPAPAQPASAPQPAPAAPATPTAAPVATATPAPVATTTAAPAAPATAAVATAAPQTQAARVATPAPAAQPGAEPLPWPSVGPRTSPWPAEPATLTASAPAADAAPARELLEQLASPFTWLFR